jgi:hypothetical protein
MSSLDCVIYLGEASINPVLTSKGYAKKKSYTWDQIFSLSPQDPLPLPLQKFPTLYMPQNTSDGDEINK